MLFIKQTMKKLFLLFLILWGWSSFAQSNDIYAGLVAYFPLNGDVKDYSPLHIDGTNYNAVLATEGNREYYNFNGYNTYIYAGNNDRGIVDSLTVSVWVKTTSNNNQWVVGHYNHLDDRGYHIYVEDGHAMLAGRDGSNTYYRLKDLNNFINDNEWHHIVGIIAQNQWTLIIDCEIRGILITNASNPLYTINSEPFSIGKYPLVNAPDPTYFEGGIDDVRVYNRVLSICEICELYHMFDEEVDPSGVEQENSNLNIDTFKIYPNPTENYFTIDLNKENTGKVQMEIYNMKGELILSKEFSDKSILINNNDFSKGTYIIKLTINGESYAKKLILQ